jgi:predicted outer membrane protein
MKPVTIAILAALCTLPLAGLPVGHAQTQGAPATDPLPQADSDFVQAAATAGSTEIDASKLALHQSNNKNVKTFAHQMIADHTKLAAQLKRVAARSGEVAQGASDPSVLNALSGLSGNEFDRKYVETVALEGHEQAIMAFEKEIADGQNAQLKRTAQEALPIIKHHYQMAQDLARKAGIRETGMARQ